MIRIAICDDHPALAAGLSAVLRTEPGFTVVGTASGEPDLGPLLYRTQPDILILDYHLPGHDGLQLCRRIAAEPTGPKVVLYSAYADAMLALAARAAGAHAAVNKAAPARDLFDLLRRVYRGERVLPPVSAGQMEEASARLEPEDLPLLSLLVDGTKPSDIVEALRMDPKELTWRTERLLSRLRVDVPATTQ